jgi:hypothetical protein
MPSNSNNQGLLSSWKEIAAYLSCDERTCRRWELDYGLPVHRMEGATKSRVYAYKDKIDAWQKSRLNGNQAAAEAPGAESRDVRPEISHAASVPPHKWKTKKLIFLSIPMAVLFVAAAAILWIRLSPGQPADFRIQGSKLIILDEEGKKLWTFDTGLPNLNSEQAYRRRFQEKTWDPVTGAPDQPYFVMQDINQDHKVEVLFSTQVKGDSATGEGEIFCFSSKGKRLWRHRVGREVEFGGKSYSADFRVEGIVPIDINGDNNLEILILAFHNPHSPTQLLLLDPEGKGVSEFFNYGQLHDYLCCDLDGNGKKEILVVGQNDEYGKGCLVVFEPTLISGCSPQVVKYPGKGLTRGTEKYYLLFPRTDFDQVLFPLKETVHRIDLLQNGRLQLDTAISRIFFELDQELRVQDVKGSDYFSDRHRELKATGKISSELNDTYYENLRKGVLYWDGTQWTSTPTMNRNGVE